MLEVEGEWRSVAHKGRPRLMKANGMKSWFSHQPSAISRFTPHLDPDEALVFCHASGHPVKTEQSRSGAASYTLRLLVQGSDQCEHDSSLTLFALGPPASI